MTEAFHCQVLEHDGRVTFIRVSGELDLATAPAFVEQLAGRAGPLVFDLRDTTFIDSSGLRALLTVTRADGGSATVICPAGAPRRILEMSGVDKLVALYEDLDTWQQAQGSGPITDGTRP